MKLLADTQACFFDFDGVLVDSVNIKTQAYMKIFAEHGPESVALIRTYHLEHGGVDRFRKITHVLNQTGRYSDEERDRLAAAFQTAVVDAVIAAPELVEGRRLLDQAREQGIDCHVVSGTPQDELQLIVERRGLKAAFRSINGSPRKKTQILNELIAGQDYERDRCLMIGDAHTDFTAAQEVGVWFFGFPVLPRVFDE